ncbi:MAG: transporter [Candidatus Lokiarchaeota archaeon]|nr:transporter [Candidatus Lokiarchaeota archaeon]
MKELSARNQIKGKIKKVIKGPVNSEITIELADGIEITSIITKNSTERLGLKEGTEAYAVIKATSVMIGKD